MFDTATREAKLRDTLATVCVEVVSKKCTGGGEGNALDPKFTLPKRAFAGASLPPPMRVKKFLSSSLTRSQLRQQHARRRIVEINTTSNNNATDGVTPMSPLSTTRRQHHRVEQTSSEDEDEEEGGFAFRLSPERKKKQQSQLKNVTTVANAAAADTAAATISTTKKLRVKIETSYPDKPLTTFATVKLTFDSEQSLDRDKIKRVQSRVDAARLVRRRPPTKKEKMKKKRTFVVGKNRRNIKRSFRSSSTWKRFARLKSRSCREERTKGRRETPAAATRVGEIL